MTNTVAMVLVALLTAMAGSTAARHKDVALHAPKTSSLRGLTLSFKISDPIAALVVVLCVGFVIGLGFIIYYLCFRNTNAQSIDPLLHLHRRGRPRSSDPLPSLHPRPGPF